MARPSSGKRPWGACWCDPEPGLCIDGGVLVQNACHRPAHMPAVPDTGSCVAARGSSKALTFANVQIDLGKDRILPIASLRGRVRPVILAGTESYIRKVGILLEPCGPGPLMHSFSVPQKGTVPPLQFRAVGKKRHHQQHTVGLLSYRTCLLA